MATLTGTQIKNTYDSLLKIEDNDGITSTKKLITDGLGNASPLSMSTTEIVSSVNIEASGFKTPTGTSSDFLLANGATTVIDITNFVTISGSQTITGQKTLDTGSYNPLVLDRYTNNNVNMSFKHSGVLKGYLGVGPSNVLTWGSSANSGSNNEIYHTGNLTISGSNTGDQDLTGYLLNTTDTLTGDLTVTEALTVQGTGDSSFIGKVGIGTDSPDANLHVYNTGNGEAIIERASGAKILLQAQSAAGVIGTSSNHDLDIKANGSTRVKVENTGNVGIGTTSPRAKLDITNGSSGQTYTNVSGLLIDVNGTSNSYSGLRVGSSTGNDHLVVTNAGNVGIGTDSPSTKLEITGSTPTAGDTTLNLKVPAGNIAIGVTEMGNILFSSSDASGGGTGSVAKISTVAGDGSGAWTGNGRPTDLAFFTQPLGASATLAESMRIDQDGNVGIGTTSPRSLIHTSDAAVGGKATFQTESNTAGDFVSTLFKVSTDDTAQFQKAGLAFERLTSNGIGSFHILNNDSNDNSNADISNARVTVNSKGYVGIGTTTPTSKLQVTGLPKYPDNATAIAAGLTVGAFYHDQGSLKIVF